MIALRALALLTLDQVRRYLRQGTVLRSLVFPIVLSIGAVLLTVAVVLYVRAPRALAITPDAADPALLAAIEEDGDTVLLVDDPAAAVRADQAALGTDGTTLWVGSGGHPPMRLEGQVRKHLGTFWRPHRPRRDRDQDVAQNNAPNRLATFVGALFALYGVVFGAGSVARDRDEGTLDAELALPVPHGIHGLARWIGGTLVLGLFFAMSVGVIHGVMGVQDALLLTLHGTLACSAATAIGLLVIGQAGLERGFAGPMSSGLVAVFGLLSAGLGGGVFGYLPIASLVARNADLAGASAGTLVLGLVAAWGFARRTAVS